jgi:Bacterial regulatory helix-turn-helix protein, lysR family/LysR substrate binding domain
VTHRLAGGDKCTAQLLHFAHAGGVQLDSLTARHRFGNPGQSRERSSNAPTEDDGQGKTEKHGQRRAAGQDDERAAHRAADDGFGYAQRDRPSRELGTAINVHHVVLATGYRPDMRRVAFLDRASIVNALAVREGYPVLDAEFQTNLPGLYVTGLAATRDFGPFFGFTVACPIAARHLSFTRAAQELFVTQSAVSREIKTLEAQIGQPLFHRVHRALKLTDAGEQLYRVTEETLGQLDAVVDRLSGADRPLTVTTTPALASLWLAPRLPRFNRSWPDIEVRVVASNDKPNLDRDELDVGIRFVAAGGDSPADEPLMTCRSFSVCAPALLRDPARPLKTPADLARHVRLDYESVRDGRSWSEWGF